MPVKITSDYATPFAAISNLRKNINNGEGLTMIEVSRAVKRTPQHCNRICSENGWTVKQYDPVSHRQMTLLVNEKTLKQCLKK